MLERILLDQDPYLADHAGKDWYHRDVWPCRWITLDETLQPPFVAAYRLRFQIDTAAEIRAHVSADERYELFLDGQGAGRGPERGDPQHWSFETYRLSLAPGAHTLVARVWSLGGLSPWAQMSAHPGFLFAVEGEWIPRLGSGVADWEAKRLPGYSFTDALPAIGAGANLDIAGDAFAWGFETGAGAGWQPAQALYPGANPNKAEADDPTNRRCTPPMHLLVPAALPAMLDRPVLPGAVRFVSDYERLRIKPPDPELVFNYAPGQSGSPVEDSVPVRSADHLAEEAPGWQALLADGAALTIPPRTRRRALVDLRSYYCAYPRLTVSGGKGAAVHLIWAEALYNEPQAVSKGQRDEIEGKYFYGVGDTFRPDGTAQRTFDTLWWQCGRYLEIRVETGDQPLTLERLDLAETRYPLEMEAKFKASDPRMELAIPILLRGLQMCAHETFFDCPYYEQMMYAGDTRLEALVTYAITQDDRLPRKALALFDASRLVSGLTQSRYPSHVRQVIPPFSLWYVGMLYDHALWRGSRDLVRELMPGARGVLDAFLGYRDSGGLVAGPPGWNFMDWSREWASGIPPEGDFGASAVINELLVLALGWAAEMETWLGEPELAQRWGRQANRLSKTIASVFWDPVHRRFSDDAAHSQASEHAQALAILSERFSPEMVAGAARALLVDRDLTRATIYMRHYLFEAFRLLNRPDAILDRLKLWFDLQPAGLKTTPETPEPTRSDCHGWGSTPLYHYLATLLGIRPDAFGFERVRIQPMLGNLVHLSGCLPHPKGAIEVDLRRERNILHGQVTLPPGLEGSFVYGSREIQLKEGKQEV